jgi:2-polyprenyl-6-hydroxyphenyl methylase/3-demethylubiquinone-9 3-methyltransferase
MDKITFSFGENWKELNKTITRKEVESSKNDLGYWIGADKIKGANVIDIGSGSGLHSLSFIELGVESLFSFDYDKHSVEATRSHWEQKGKPSNWTVTHGSVLDDDFISTLGSYDIVYSWGVLHHTGNMWKAISNAATLVKPGGVFFITIYNDYNFERSIRDKTNYNNAGFIGKKLLESKFILKEMLILLKSGKNPFAWNRKKERGMNVYRDIVDWLGGLPYEIANEDEMLQFGLNNGFSLKRIWCKEACHYYVFEKSSS